MEWSDLSVLITGGTGSFGQKFIEIALRDLKPKRLIVFSRDELKQHAMREAGLDGESLRYFIGDVRDKDRLRRAMQGVDVVVHAAALKQVPACEYNPMEAVKTNVFGTQNVIDAAIDCGVRRVMGISTDKAVSPVNLYGASKLCAEKLLIQGNAYVGTAATRLSCTRYGNVVGSRGSVIPVFQRQVSSGKLTVTDERMTRFWLTREQGVRFVIGCIEAMQGRELFVPKIPSLKIVDLAKAIGPECEIEIIGIRPGEKLHESLVSADESRHTVDAEGMFVIHYANSPWETATRVEGKPLPEGFEYRSDTNDKWLSPSEVREMLEAS